MYSPSYSREPDQAVVIDFMKQHPFAMLIGIDAETKPVATQVPLFIDEREGTIYLTGHVQRKTDHYHAYDQNSNVLAVFTGAHTYISASWYDDKQMASTWNYMSVHAKGVLRFLNDAELLEVLKRTTSHFENDPHSPSLVEKMTDEYVAKNMKAIAAFEVEVKKLDAVFKLSQNRKEKDYDQIARRLKEQGADAAEIAKLMEERKSKVFPS